MQPMYIKSSNEKIAKELGTLDQFTLDDPKLPPKAIIVTSNAGNTKQFAMPWLKPLNTLFPGKKDFSWFILVGNQPQNHTYCANFIKAMGKVPNIYSAIHTFIKRKGARLIKKETFDLKKGLN